MKEINSFISNSSINKFILKLIIFILIIIIIDVLLGKLIELSYKNCYFETSNSGTKLNYTLKQRNEVLIFCSSRAQYQYIPNIIGENIESSIYNAGQGASGIEYHLLLLKLILKKYKPKIIIYEFYPPSLIEYNWMNQAKNYLTPYDNNDEVKSYLINENPRYAKTSLMNLYKYNEKFIYALISLFKNDPNKSGYSPLIGEYNPPIKIKNNIEKQKIKEDEKIVEAFQEFIELTKENNIKLYVFASPKWEPVSGCTYLSETVKNILENNSVPYFVISQNKYPEFKKVKYFQDDHHLNHDGALIYSEIVGKILEKQLNKFD